MHRKHQAPTPTSSMSSNGDTMPVASDGAKDDALLALEQQFEVLAREFSMLLKSSATRNERGKRRNDCDAGQAKGSGELSLAGDETNRRAAKDRHLRRHRLDMRRVIVVVVARVVEECHRSVVTAKRKRQREAVVIVVPLNILPRCRVGISADVAV